MEETDAQTIWSWLEGSGVAVAMREWTWAYPIVEIAHIIGFVVLVGAAFMFDLRLLGFIALVADHRTCSSFIALVAAGPARSCADWIPDVHD